MRRRLRRWWHIPALWPICFAILFGKDVGQLDLDRPFDHFGFLDLFNSTGELNVIFPEVLPVITGMLEAGLKATVLRSSESLDVEGAKEPSRSRLNRRSMSSATPPGWFFKHFFAIFFSNSHHAIKISNLTGILL